MLTFVDVIQIIGATTNASPTVTSVWVPIMRFVMRSGNALHDTLRVEQVHTVAQNLRDILRGPMGSQLYSVPNASKIFYVLCLTSLITSYGEILIRHLLKANSATTIMRPWKRRGTLTHLNIVSFWFLSRSLVYPWRQPHHSTTYELTWVGQYVFYGEPTKSFETFNSPYRGQLSDLDCLETWIRSRIWVLCYDYFTRRFYFQALGFGGNEKCSNNS